MAEFEEDVNCVSAKRKHFLGSYSTPEEAETALVVINTEAEFEDSLLGDEGSRKKRCWREFKGRKLPCGVRKDKGKFRVRLWHPQLKKYVSFGAYSTSEEAAAVADRKRAALQELYGGEPMGSSECEDDDKVLQETEGGEASSVVVADRKREVYGAKVRGSGVCEDDDNVLQETESEEASVVADRKREVYGSKVRGIGECEDGDKVLQETEIEEAAVIDDEKQEVCGAKVRGSGECEDDDKVLQETESEEAAVIADGKQEVYGAKVRGRGECEDDDKVLQEIESEEAAVIADGKQQVCGAKVRGSGECEDDDEILRETKSEEAVVADKKQEVCGDKVRGSVECVDDDEVLQETESEESAVIADKKMAEFEEQFKGKEDMNIVESEICNGASAKSKQFLGVCKKGNNWRAKIRHPKLKAQVHLGCYSTPEEAALVVINKKAEFQETLNGEDGLRMKRRRDGFLGCKLPSGVRSEGGMFRVRMWHPVLKRDVSVGAYSTCEEAAVVADRKRAELRELCVRKRRGNSECEGDDKVLQETESEEASVVADKKREVYRVEVSCSGECEDNNMVLQETESVEASVVADTKREGYGSKVRGSGECEDDDKVLQETESVEASVVADRKREVNGSKVRGSGECEDDNKVLQETVSEETPVVSEGKRKVYGAKVRGSCECEDDDKVLQETASEEAAVIADGKRQVYGVKVRSSGECEDDDKVLQETESEEASVVADRKQEVYREKVRGSGECEDDDKVLQETVSEEVSVVTDRKQEVYRAKVRGSGECEDDDKVLQETEGEEASVVADRKQEVCRAKVRGSGVCDDDDKVLQEAESEEAAVIADKKRADFEEKFKVKEDVNIVENETCDGVSAKRKQFLGVSKKENKRQARIRVEKRHRHEFEGRQLPKGVTRECGKFRVRLWHPELNKYASYGYYTSCEEAVVFADRKRAELQELYEGKPRGCSECDNDDKVLQQTESEEAAVVADRKRKRRRAELMEVYGGKVRGSGECEDDDKVLQETTSEVDFEEQFKGKADVNIVEDETCDGVTAKSKHFFGVTKMGNKWRGRIRHPKLKVNVHLGHFSTPEEAALAVKNKKAEFEKAFNCEFKGRNPSRVVRKDKGSRGVRRDKGKFRVRIWHPELKRDISFGAYSTYEEAVVVADSKRAEMRGLHGGKPRGKGDCEDDGEVLQECETSKGGDSH